MYVCMYVRTYVCMYVCMLIIYNHYHRFCWFTGRLFALSSLGFSQEVLRTAFGVFLGVHSFQFHHAGRGIWARLECLELVAGKASWRWNNCPCNWYLMLRFVFLIFFLISVLSMFYPEVKPALSVGSQFLRSYDHVFLWSLLSSGYESNLNGYKFEGWVPFVKTISYCCRLFFHSHHLIPFATTKHI